MEDHSKLACPPSRPAAPAGTDGGLAAQSVGPPARSNRLRGLLLLAVFAIVGSVGGWFAYQWRYENVENFRRQCDIANAKGEWDKLAPVAAKWSRLEPQAADPWLFRAVAAEGLNDWPAAVQYLDRVPRSDPRAVAALVRKAVAEFEQLNRPWEGVRTCDEVLQIEPRVLIAHKQTIFFFAMTLQRAEMVRRIRQAIRLRRDSPETYIYLVSANWLYSAALYRHNTRWLEGDPESEVFRIGQAMQVYTSQAKSDAERAAEFEHIPPPEQLLERYPHNLELLTWFLNRAITDGDLEQVQRLLEAVPQEAVESDARICRARAWCEDTLGNFERAEELLRRALEIDPYWWQLHFQLHDLLRRRGRAEESEREREIYKISHDISLAIMTMNRTEEGFDDPKFSGTLIKLAELVGDDDVVAALRERMAAP